MARYMTIIGEGFDKTPDPGIFKNCKVDAEDCGILYRRVLSLRDRLIAN